jgi:hypothetical protein
MDDRDKLDLTTVADVLRELQPSGSGTTEVLIRDVLRRTALRMPRVVTLTRRYGAELAARLGVGHVRYEPGRYVRGIGPMPARIYLSASVSRN